MEPASNDAASPALSAPASTHAVFPVPPVPPVRRRLASLLYEALLLLALILIASFLVIGFVVSLQPGWSQALFRLYLLPVIAWYFIWFWTHGGQSLPMKTWRIRVVDASGRALSLKRALLRFFYCLLVYGPVGAGIALLFVAGHVSPLITIWLFVPAIAAWWWARFDADRQSLHDRLAGTRLIDTRAQDPA